jgi:polyprenyl P-hydroxybenzoate/phenylacrylic acid decarboxylase-like protein
MQAFLTEYTGAADGQIRVYGKEDWMSPVASGSGAPAAMVVVPCSTGTLSAIATGACNNLIERAADVTLKERRQLILVPREAPFSTIHLENMLKLSQMGAVILPAAPGFYHQPQTIDDLVDFVVARILNLLNIPRTCCRAGASITGATIEAGVARAAGAGPAWRLRHGAHAGCEQAGRPVVYAGTRLDLYVMNGGCCPLDHSVRWRRRIRGWTCRGARCSIPCCCRCRC